MDAFIVWCGFFGAWLLVAGPVYQAALELGEQELMRAGIERVSAGLRDTVAPVSAWWWLFPPVLYLKHRRREAAQRELLLSHLTPEQTRQMLAFMNKAAGWWLVGLGGLLIAAKETGELVDFYEWPGWTFAALAVVMALLALANAGLRMQRTRQLIQPRLV
ncbi:hypothetical protein KOI35_31970 [Actinoplanes bogorensis]|uniref:DUF4328 domain-containing protein n=1 Tax=Paractinoplanes bogorensis TaxID=1610840 RepID=A0ABS5YXM9_9ACTN|nr:hypothetical protein [Actinoplanes bogorensis]MBU2668138.1 hypothetical protein [Actinoplanes bogorensis]